MQDQLLEAQRLNDALRAEREIYVNMNQVGNAPQRYATYRVGSRGKQVKMFSFLSQNCPFNVVSRVYLFSRGRSFFVDVQLSI